MKDISWSYGEDLIFPFSISDTTSSFDILMDISLNKSYRFQNIYTEIQTKFPSGKVEKDVVSLDVMDRFGNWYGQCKGEKCKIGLLLQSKTKFPEPGEYEIRLSQHMRQNPLPGIHSFALKIKPYQEK